MTDAPPLNGLVTANEKMRAAITECIGMIDNCGGAPTEPASLVQMVRERLGREISVCEANHD